jgi:hypothetical protein
MNDRGKIQTIPTTMVTGYWDPGSSSEIPEAIKIVMANGTRAVYRLQVEQPHPQCLKAIDLIRIMNETTYGGYKNGR